MRRALLVWPLLEILAVWGLASLIGWGWTLLALLACMPVGFAIMRSAGEHAFADLRAAGGAGLPQGRGSRHALRFAAGLLIAIPGPITTVLGFALLTGPGQRLARRWLGARVTLLAAGGSSTRGSSAGGYDSGDVVQGSVVDPDMRQEPSRSPELDS